MTNKIILAGFTAVIISLVVVGNYITAPVLEHNIELQDQIQQLKADKLGLSQELIESKVELSTELKERYQYVADVHEILEADLVSDKATMDNLSRVEERLRGKQVVIISDTVNIK